MINYRTRFLGQKFGKLLVIAYHSVDEKKRINWLCKCDCGGEKIVRSGYLRSSETRSCGCLSKRMNISSPTWKGYKEISLSFWNKIKEGALRRKILFDIKIEEAWDLFEKQEKKCALSGVDLKFKIHCKDRSANSSLDRIDPKKGYIIDNVQWVDKKINYMKHTLNEGEFINFCKLVAINARVA